MNIVPPNTKTPIAKKARGYTGRHNTNVAEDCVALRPSGAFLSSVLELARWDAVLYTDRVLTDAERRQMYTIERRPRGRLRLRLARGVMEGTEIRVAPIRVAPESSSKP